MKGILLINLGTPDTPTLFSVFRFLREFLRDPRVIDIPAVVRWILVNCIIIPLRCKISTKAYQKIWLKNGSPLLVYTKAFKEALAQKLGPHYQVEYGMRYGSPSIQTALHQLRACHSITVIPLFPQYSSAATGSAIEKTLDLISKQWNIPEIFVLRDFYREKNFIKAYAKLVEKTLQDHSIDMLVFSYHGLPERHIAKSHCKAVCDKQSACPSVNEQSLFCYRAQCYETSRLIADVLGFSSAHYATAFQSRLGRTPWIKPYTDLFLPELIQQGIKNIAIACPSFVADCLETLEEVNIRTREQWQKLGGGEFIFIPCLNDNPDWVEAMKEIILSKGETN